MSNSAVLKYSLTNEHILLRDSINRFVKNDYIISGKDADADGIGYSIQAWETLADMGVLGALFPENQGGFGGSGMDIALVFESLGFGLVVGPYIDSAILSGTILGFSKRDIEKNLISELIDGKSLTVLAHDEDDGQNPLAELKTTAKQLERGFQLDGLKSTIKFPENADNFLITARFLSAQENKDDIGIFLVPRSKKGIELTSCKTIDGGRAANIRLRQVNLDQHNLLTLSYKAIDVLTIAKNRALLAICAEALGIMEKIKQLTIEYLKTRKQFGMVIGKFQALQHRIAEMLIQIEQSRSAVTSASIALDYKHSDVNKKIAAAKYTISRIGTLIAEESIQMHGGIGVTWEYELSHFARRLIMIDQELGDEDFHLGQFMASDPLVAP